MTDMAGITTVAVEHLPVDHKRPTHAGRYRHHAEIPDASARTQPPLSDRESLGVEIAVHINTGQLVQMSAQWEAFPRRDIHGRHRCAVAFNRAGASHADGHRVGVMLAARSLELLPDQRRQGREMRLRSHIMVDLAPASVEKFAALTNKADLKFRGADINGAHNASHHCLRGATRVGFGQLRTWR